MVSVHYGRLKPIEDAYKYRRQGMSGIVDVSFWISDREPPYLSGSYLKFLVEEEEYRIYNPLRLKFSINFLVSFLRTFFRKTGSEAHSFEIVEVPNKIIW